MSEPKVISDKTFDNLVEWLKKVSTGNTFCIVTRDEHGDEILTPRQSRPCYGEMRKYKNKSLNRKEDMFPGDLKNNFPEGEPCGVAVRYNVVGKENIEAFKMYWGEYNPWIGEYSKFIHFIQSDENTLIGVICTTGDFKPTRFVSAMMVSRYTINQDFMKKAERFEKLGLNERERFLTSLITTVFADKVSFSAKSSVLSSRSNIKRIFKGDINDLDGGLLWSEGADYNRPNISEHFVDEWSLETETKKSYDSKLNFPMKTFTDKEWVDIVKEARN